MVVVVLRCAQPYCLQPLTNPTCLICMNSPCSPFPIIIISFSHLAPNPLGFRHTTASHLNVSPPLFSPSLFSPPLFFTPSLLIINTELVALELLVNSVTMAFALVSMIAGIFGMNLATGWESSTVAFWTVCALSCVLGLFICVAVVLYARAKRLLFISSMLEGGRGVAT